MDEQKRVEELQKRESDGWTALEKTLDKDDLARVARLIEISLELERLSNL